MKTKVIPVIAGLAASLSLGALVATPVLLTPSAAHAQKQNTLGTLLSGLINVNVQNVDVDVDVTDVVDVSDVLNDNQVDVLRNAIINIPVASNNQNVLNNLLRDADIIDDNQIVVGVLGGTFFVTDL